MPCPKCGDRGGYYEFSGEGFVFCDCAIGVLQQKEAYDTYLEPDPVPIIVEDKEISC